MDVGSLRFAGRIGGDGEKARQRPACEGLGDGKRVETLADASQLKKSGATNQLMPRANKSEFHPPKN